MVCRLKVLGFLILLLSGGGESFGNIEPEVVTTSRRVAGYTLKAPHTIKGYFPAGAELRILESKGMYSKVEYVSSSGKKTRARVLRSQLGLPTYVDPSQLPTRSLGNKEAWVMKEDGEYDTTYLSEREKLALAQEGFKWKHAETEHFVLHFERSIFAKRVARMAEFYYDYIAIDLQGPKDRYRGKSHILIYRTPERWLKFMKAHGPPDMTWAFAFVSGPTMYLQEASDGRSSAGVLAHEMTHLIMNRFFERSPPVWLNEGIAEWYGEFAYSAYKGTRISRGKVFPRIEQIYPLQVLMSLEQYPKDREAVSLYYLTSKYLVGFLRIKHPEEDFQTFMAKVLSGEDAWQQIRSIYGYNTIEELRDKFQNFGHFK